MESTVRLAEHGGGAVADASAAWVSTSQRCLGDLAGLGVETSKEMIRMMAELQQATLDAMREQQTAAARWQAAWPEMLTDPSRWYQRLLIETLDGAQRTIRLMGANARAMNEAADRLQRSAEQVGRQVEESLLRGAARMRETASRAA